MPGKDLDEYLLPGNKVRPKVSSRALLFLGRTHLQLETGTAALEKVVFGR